MSSNASNAQAIPQSATVAARQPAPQPIATLRNVTKSLPLFSLQIAKLDIWRGEFLSVVGPSGAGKSTLLSILGGFLKPDDGEVTIAGGPLSAQTGGKRIIRTVFQDLGLFPHLTVKEHLRVAAAAVKQGPVTPDQAAEEWLTRLRLQDKKKDKPSKLSGGQKQRLALGRALICAPQLLLLDEPMSALDHALRAELWDDIDSITGTAPDTTWVVVTHDPDLALSRSSRILVLEGGRTAQAGLPSEVYAKPRSEVVARLLGPANVIPWQGGTAVVRPERVRLYPLGAVPATDFNAEAVVTRRTYHGSATQYALLWQGATLFSRQYTDPEQPVEIASTVQFGWDHADAISLS